MDTENTPSLLSLCLTQACANLRNYTPEQISTLDISTKERILYYLQSIGNCTSILTQNIYLSLCKGVSELPLPLLPHFPQSIVREGILSASGIRTFDLSEFWKVSVDTLMEIFRTHTTITNLNLKNCKQTSNSVL